MFEKSDLFGFARMFAGKAGLEAGDLVTATEGTKVSKIAEALSRVGQVGIGQEMKFEVQRGGRVSKVVIKPE